MTSYSSRIPHLARAILDKRKLRESGNFIYRLDTANTSLTSSKSFSSSSLFFKVKAVPRRARDPKGILPTNNQLAPPSPLPAAPSSKSPPPYGVELPQEEDRYDPSRDLERKQTFRTITFGFIVVVSGFIAYVYQSYQNDLKQYYGKGNVLPQNADVSSRWRDANRNFDREVDDAERLMLLRWKRKRLVREAYGDVLEVSVGTGRNMDLYDTRPYSAVEGATYGRDTRHMITSLTFNDESPVMIENAKKKWADEQKKKRAGDRFAGAVNWYVGDAGDKDVLPRPPGGYDTIIQSWGICSMADPVKFLRQLSRLARQPNEEVKNSSPKKLRDQEAEDGKGGRIFLLEHGRAKYDWLNRFLDKSAPMHADRYGCWYNKDIAKVIEESGLVIERERRYNFGTTYEYVLRPVPGPLPGEETRAEVDATSEKEESGKKGWLSGFWKR